MTDKRYQEIGGVSLLIFSLILLLSLLTFNINDLEALAADKPVSNLIGPFGAYFSSFLRAGFGYSSYIIFAVFAVAGWCFLRKGTLIHVLEKIFSLLFLTISTSMLVSLLIYSIPHFAGGYSGLYLSNLSKEYFGSTGAYIVIAAVNIIGLILLGIVSLNAIINKTNDPESASRLFAAFKALFKKIFIYDIKDIIPYNNLFEDYENRGRRPWITKRKIIIGQPAQPKAENLLLEMKPIQNALVPLGADDFAVRATHDISYTEQTTQYDDNDKDVSFNDASDAAAAFQNTYTIQNEIKTADHGQSGQDYFSEDILDKIERNRIRAAEADLQIQEAEIIDAGDLQTQNLDEFADSETDEEFEEDDADELYPYNKTEKTETALLIDRNKEEDAEFEESKTVAYVPRVFTKIHLNGKYNVPDHFFERSKQEDQDWQNEARRNSEILVKTLKDFGVESRVINVNRGPVITLYEIQIAPGIKVNRIVGLSDDLAMALAAASVRIVAPIPGKSAIGIEIPNRKREMVTFGDIVVTDEYKNHSGRLKTVMGKDILGKPLTIDLKKMPHLLIAGATGAGKSVCVNSIIAGLIYNYDPNYLRFILIDPKMVELQLYNGMPHLLTPVITESFQAPYALKWAMNEMERRYKLLSEVNCRDIDKYNEKIANYEDDYERLPYIVIIIDELADLMMLAAKEIEGVITRIAQKARAVGIHLVLATQRPSVDIITGIIKANFPARMAFQVAQKTDSRTILDYNGAEALLGKGDMLYQSPLSSFPVRIQGAFISEEEIIKVVKHLRKLGKPSYIDIDHEELEEQDEELDLSGEDALFTEAVKIVEETKKASVSYIQRRLCIGFNRAARMIEMMEERGFVGPQQGSKAREVYI